MSKRQITNINYEICNEDFNVFYNYIEKLNKDDLIMFLAYIYGRLEMCHKLSK